MKATRYAVCRSEDGLWWRGGTSWDADVERSLRFAFMSTATCQAADELPYGLAWTVEPVSGEDDATIRQRNEAIVVGHVRTVLEGR